MIIILSTGMPENFEYSDSDEAFSGVLKSKLLSLKSSIGGRFLIL